MRILLRNKETGLFLVGPDQWTDSVDCAVDFRFLDRALKYAQAWTASEVEVVIGFDDPEGFSSIPVERAAQQMQAVA